ncbi:hypothetical protein QVD17_07149 [Tagetes erecta]|uniref:Large ribosomal subunit protein uL2 C-terminal domain-containing protein n=1 Tax=Tagetes erecta TaxID=13708 RepID=A0AAD8PCP5_TARER|nr:hypothetical protein QVD17_07149 [Tagetes erecta]
MLSRLKAFFWFFPTLFRLLYDITAWFGLLSDITDNVVFCFILMKVVLQPKRKRVSGTVFEASSSSAGQVTRRASMLRSIARCNAVSVVDGSIGNAEEPVVDLLLSSCYMDLGECNEICEFYGARFWFSERVKSVALSLRPQYNLGGEEVIAGDVSEKKAEELKLLDEEEEEQLIDYDSEPEYYETEEKDMILPSTSRKPYALEEACTVWEAVLIDKNKESTSTDMPLGTNIHHIEITLEKGGQLAREVGVVAKLIAKEEKSTTLKLPFRDVRLISKNFSAIVRQVGNVGVN